MSQGLDQVNDIHPMPLSFILLDWFYILHSVYLHTADVIILLSLQRLGGGKISAGHIIIDWYTGSKDD